MKSIHLMAIAALCVSTTCFAQEKPAALEMTGVPELPQRIFDDLASYENVRGAGFASWHPDGKGMLIRTRFSNVSQLHSVEEAGSRRTQLTFDDEPTRGVYIKGAKDGAMLLAKSTGGNENTQIYFRHPDGTRKLLTDGKSRNGLGPFSPDGGRVIITSNQRNGKDTDIYIADPRGTVGMQMLYETDGEFWFPVDWSPDGSELLLVKYVSATQSSLGILNIESRELRRIDLKDTEGNTPERYAVGACAFSADGEMLYVSNNLGGEFQQLAEVDPASGSIVRWITGDINWDVENLDVHEETGRLAVVINVDGSSDVRIYRRARGGREGNGWVSTAPVDLGPVIVYGIKYSLDGTQLAMSIIRPDAPADVYVAAVSEITSTNGNQVRRFMKDGEGTVTRWTYSELGDLNSEEFIAPQQIKFTSFDEREIPAYYYKPKTASEANPAPVMLVIHGGPEGQYRPYFSSSIQYYAGKKGIAVIAPNVRGSDGYGKTYLDLDNAEKREDSVKDIGALLDWIAAQPDLDENRVIVTGGSYGGYMVLASLTNYPDRIKAGIDRVGIANFITFLEKTKAYRRDLRRSEYGDERDPEMRKVFERINPTANAHKIRSALLVVHGKNDPRVPFYEAQQIAEIVGKQGTPVWTLYADNEGHGFGKKENRDYQAAVEALFVEKFILESQEAEVASQATVADE